MGPTRPKLVVVGVMAAFAVWLAGAAEPPKLPPLNARVLQFARANVGKRVGDGICITLARDALAHAGAKRYPLSDPKGDYAWGRKIDEFKDALPGDILQFRDAEFKGKKRVAKRRTIWWHSTYPHHTAIVSDVKEGGKVVDVLHQNVAGSDSKEEADKRIVREDTLRIDSLQPGGWVRIYRPEPDALEPE